MAASALICFFPVLVNSVKGLRSIDQAALDLFRSLDASQYEIFRKLRLPSALPYVFPALKVSTSLAVVGVGEFVGASKGIGFLILTSSYRFEIATMFAAAGASALGVVAFFGAVAYIERRIVWWDHPEVE